MSRDSKEIMDYDDKVYQESKYEEFLDQVYADLDDMGSCLFWEFANKAEKAHELKTGEMLDSAFETAFSELCAVDEEAVYLNELDYVLKAYRIKQKEDNMQNMWDV